ncbi:MAG TPA: hypothetical protein VEC06_00780 [Paucimonas sp.]|nr:hypothetical protein [Paucimonas sp.]
MTAQLEIAGTASGSASKGRSSGAVRAQDWLLALQRELLANAGVQTSLARTEHQMRPANGESSGQDKAMPDRAMARESVSAASPAVASSGSGASLETTPARADAEGSDGTASFGDGAAAKTRLSAGAVAAPTKQFHPAAVPAADSRSTALDHRFPIAAPAARNEPAEAARLPPAAREMPSVVPPRLPAIQAPIRAKEAVEHQAAGAQQQAGAFQDKQYAPKQLHLYDGMGGVEAWLRDADLPEPQAVAVMLALRQTLREAGKELVALTLNGKKIYGEEKDGRPPNMDEGKVEDTAAARSGTRSVFDPAVQRSINRKER